MSLNSQYGCPGSLASRDIFFKAAEPPVLKKRVLESGRAGNTGLPRFRLRCRESSLYLRNEKSFTSPQKREWSAQIKKTQQEETLNTGPVRQKENARSRIFRKPLEPRRQNKARRCAQGNLERIIKSSEIAPEHRLDSDACHHEAYGQIGWLKKISAEVASPTLPTCRRSTQMKIAWSRL